MKKLSRLLTLLCCLATTPALADITTGLVLHLPLNESSGTTITDSSPLALSGTWQGSALSTVTGPFSGSTAPSFNGSNNYISFADNANHDFSGSFTFAAWAKTSTVSSLALAAKNDAGFSSGWDMLIDGGAIQAVARPVGLNHNPGTPDFNNNVWRHVAETLTYSGGNVTGRYYLDGALVNTSGTVAWTPTANADQTHIGARRGAIFWNGSLKEVRLYSRALSAGDVAELYTFSPFVPQVIFITRLNRQRSHFDAYGVHLLCPL